MPGIPQIWFSGIASSPSPASLLIVLLRAIPEYVNNMLNNIKAIDLSKLKPLTTIFRSLINGITLMLLNLLYIETGTPFEKIIIDNHNNYKSITIGMFRCYIIIELIINLEIIIYIIFLYFIISQMGFRILAILHTLSAVDFSY